MDNTPTHYREATPAVHNGGSISRDQVELIKRTIAKGSTDDELQLFVQVCERTGLSPFARQIYAVKRWDGRERREVMSIQVSIDGFRLIADRAAASRGLLRGEEPTQWADENGVWHDEWLKASAPAGARYTVVITHHSGAQARFSAVARFAAYAQKTKEGKPSGLWGQMPDVMIAKCAEALALRKAFPAELAGLYTTDEMGQAAAARGGDYGASKVTPVAEVQPVGDVIDATIVESAPAPALNPDQISAIDAKRQLVTAAKGDKNVARQAWCSVYDEGHKDPIQRIELDVMLTTIDELLSATEVSEPVAAPAGVPASGVTPGQVKKIHAIRNEIGLDDAAYRSVLSEVAGVSSSKQLTRAQAEKVIDRLSSTTPALGSNAAYEAAWGGEGSR